MPRFVNHIVSPVGNRAATSITAVMSIEYDPPCMSMMMRIKVWPQDR